MNVVQDAVSVSDVKVLQRRRDDLVTGRATQLGELSTDLTPDAGDEDPHVPQRRHADSSATGARPRSGSHHARLSAYQATVSASPSSNPISGFQPSSLRIFDESRM